MTIAILGTGLLGSGFARALAKMGESVCVWNRTLDRARPLAADGIAVADTAESAVHGASRVHIVVSDDAAVDAVLAAAAPGIAPGTFVIDHSTTSTEGAVRRTREWNAKGIRYQHAPVFMGPQNALESTGLMLISGDAKAIDELRSALTPMTGKLIELGTRVDQAAGYKLIGNLLLMAITAGFRDMLALAKSMQMGPADIATLLGSFNPGVSLPQRFKRMADADWANPSWELAMARKDARLMQAEVEHAGLEMVMLPALAAVMDQAIARGDGNADWTVVAKGLV
jgi:3-hydroxyisobutyrate dehydrogenase